LLLHAYEQYNTTVTISTDFKEEAEGNPVRPLLSVLTSGLTFHSFTNN